MLVQLGYLVLVDGWACGVLDSGALERYCFGLVLKSTEFFFLIRSDLDLFQKLVRRRVLVQLRS